MARAPETGFYFEPLSERLALVVEGSPFPSDDHWAWLGDPIDMTPEQAQLLVAVRWPGLDPASLDVEFDLNFERAVKAHEEAQQEKQAGVQRLPREFDVDIDGLIEQAVHLRDQVRAVSLQAPSAASEEAAAEASRLQELIEQAKSLAEPNHPGRVLEVQQAPAQSMAILQRGAEAPRPVQPPAAATPAAPIAPAIRAPQRPAPPRPELPPRVLIPEIIAEKSGPRASVRQRARPRPEPTSGASQNPPAAPGPIDPQQIAPPRTPPKMEAPIAPRRSAKTEPPPPAQPESKPEAPPAKRRPNIRDRK